MNPARDSNLKDPILDIAARFWDDERYAAFRTCYKSMRVIDDLIDENRDPSESDKEELISRLYELQETLENELSETRKKFHIPHWPWEKLARAMIYDVNNNGFKTFKSFLDYCEGAAIAPASVFMHLCGIVKKDDKYSIPEFDIREVARPLAIFCYLVHIMRDFEKDQKSNLNYFADDMLQETGVEKSTLKKIAHEGKATKEFRHLMKKYYSIADDYKNKSRQMLDRLDLEPKYLLSLEILYSLYMQIFERIDVANGNFTASELNPSTEEVKERINQTILSFSR